ncbi:type II secretion system major pseudopilin GspG [Defluviimonas salinarum]|uniref:Type II secretion system core protein G n=1 Tax=Defluviimonas salinarum TaxID=2992147 RepID=A0ABT3J798_9RHOB|nr:type II secretion system major pseudopilin GspG [Defluviimonas salinarum]MCW3783536.1 type II secretion system major pseudopilin GspG [Defluviimonas salinarum]
MIRTTKRGTWGRNAGLTILEILVVLAIIAMVAAVAGPRVISYLGRAKSETAALQIKSLGNAVQLYYIDLGRYPTDAEGLGALAAAPAGAEGWNGPYITTAAGLSDPWGRDYLYAALDDAKGFSIRSLGRDGRDGGAGEDADLSF